MTYKLVKWISYHATSKQTYYSLAFCANQVSIDFLSKSHADISNLFPQGHLASAVKMRQLLQLAQWNDRLHNMSPRHKILDWKLSSTPPHYNEQEISQSKRIFYSASNNLLKRFRLLSDLLIYIYSHLRIFLIGIFWYTRWFYNDNKGF